MSESRVESEATIRLSSNPFAPPQVKSASVKLAQWSSEGTRIGGVVSHSCGGFTAVISIHSTGARKTTRASARAA